MKKTLFILNFSICVIANAQTQSDPVLVNKIHTEHNKTDASSLPFYKTTNQSATKPVHVNSQYSRSLVTKKKFASSSNCYGLLVSESRCLTANQATHTILFTHRLGPDFHPTGANTGFIMSTFSNDGGNTWDSILTVNQAAPYLCRYPSGAIYNPSGNTLTSGAYNVVTGPFTNSTTGITGDWTGNFFASTKLDHTNTDVQNVEVNATPGVPKQDFVRIGMQSTDDKVIVTGSLYKDANGTTAVAQMYRGASINYARYNAGSFTWSVDSIKPNFLPDPTNQTPQVSYGDALTAWSQDGIVGYVIFLGIDSSATGNNLTYQPLVWKTTNGGTSWAQLPLFDFASIPAIGNRLFKIKNGINAKASFSDLNGADALVDVNNNLHIISTIYSAASNNADSLGYIANRLDHISYIYDTYTTSSAGWAALLIDSLHTTVTSGINAPFVSTDPNLVDTVNSDARIQASKSADGNHFFYLWTDSDPSNDENVSPDIFGKGYNFVNNTATPTMQFTTDSYNFFMYASNYALVNGSTYTIPVTVSVDRLGNRDPESTFDHYYVSGIEFDESSFVGINELTENGNLSISQNYPNPFNRLTSIDVTLKEPSEISLEVYNMMGQKVVSKNSEKSATGTHTFTVDGSKLTPGVYFYTVKTETSSITRKMIVQ